MSHDDLERIGRALVADGKGMLAADETPATLTKRFDGRGIRSTVESRRAYRDMLFTAGVAEFISGVIMQNETIHQSSADGTPFARLLSNQGIVPGIKVDAGAQRLHRGRRDRHPPLPAAARPRGDARDRVPVGRPERSDGHGPPERPQSRARARDGHLLLTDACCKTPRSWPGTDRARI
jgi:hypothetical protein